MRFVVVVSLVLACAAAARAANSDGIPMGDLAAIAGGAVVAAGDDCGSVAYNPAGLVGIPRNSVSISVVGLDYLNELGRAAKREALQLFALAPVRRGEGKGEGSAA